ncbi:Mannosyl phosphorylinositol ceramide synthase SUR1 [Ophiocordyceps camponoti-floridani]|uniref:Mannosyl phosphorylinositol ceramide synthase SUR1 n=1 Tax=Ophiocordyceps camponoti-floridani TaxID=2030778 RepID=A0A8H4QDS8_9HYPO|nr:Mannosyl phosphorylinositol ceramide synthase SUR1 [Ophiocordyceps camponoti-floridani]
MASSYVRLRRLILSLVFIAIVFSLVFRVAVSVNRIFGAHAGNALTQEQVRAAAEAAASRGHRRKRPVPRILHQVFHNWHQPGNETLPPDWQAARQTCLDLHPTWEHKLWTELASREFIRSEYPYFLDTYDGFKFPVQRIDALRYFLMRHFGGIYMDLDNGCRANLDPLLYYPAWVTDGGQGTLSNNILGAEPEHPFWILMTDTLGLWARDFLLPYITISYASGQWYETEMWQIYHARKPPTEPDLLRVMMDMRPSGAPWVFFTAGRGGTWDNWDNQVLGWMGNHLPRLMLYMAASAGLVAGAWYLVGQRRRYQRLANGPSLSP